MSHPSTPEPNSDAAAGVAGSHFPRGVCAATANHRGTCEEASGWFDAPSSPHDLSPVLAAALSRALAAVPGMAPDVVVAAAAAPRVHAVIADAVRQEREALAEALHVQRFAHRRGEAGGPDSYYNGVLAAVRMVCPESHNGRTHGEMSRTAQVTS